MYVEKKTELEVVCLSKEKDEGTDMTRKTADRNSMIK